MTQLMRKSRQYRLTMRIHIALQQIAAVNSTKAAWATRMLKERVDPALKDFQLLD